MSLLLMSFIGISFLVINSAGSMFGAVQCMALIQKYQTVKSFPAGNQSPGVASFLGIVLLISVTSPWYWTLPQGIFPLSITWCLITPSSPFSISMMMKTPHYSGTTLPLNFSLIKSCCNLGIFLYFMINGSLPLNGRINEGSLNVRTTWMPRINPTRLTLVWRSLYRMILLQSLVTLLLILSFRIPQLIHMRLLLMLPPLWSHFWSPLVAVLAKPRVLSPPKSFRMKYMPPTVLNILYPPCQSSLNLILIVPWNNFLI